MSSTHGNKKFGASRHGQGSNVNQSRHGGRNVAHSVVSQSRMGGKSVGYMSSRSGIMSSASKKNLPSTGTGDKPSGKAPVQVLDEAGQDVTPQALIQIDPNAVRKGQSNILADSSGGTPTDLMSSASIYQTGTVSTYGGGPFTRSVFSTSQSERSSDSIGDDMGEGGADLTADWAEIRHRREEVKEVLTDSDLEKTISIDLTETEMIWLLDMPGICVSLESDEATAIKEKNEKYKALVKSRIGNDLYAERGMNTFNDAPKVKHVQTTKINYNDVGSTATLWDMFDTYEAIREAERKAKEALEEAEEAAALDAEKTDEAKADGDAEKTDAAKPNARGLESRGTMMSDTDSVFASKESGVASVPDAQTRNDDLILKSDALLRDLFIMERVVNLNTYQPKQASYRGFEIIEDIDKVKDEETKPGQIVVTDMGPNLDRLWSYQCPLTKGRNISCMSWNKVNPDLIAVGYGQFEFTGQKSGIVCCWSLKNPEFPERIYNTTAGITSMDFSATNPNLLAVGLYDGTVAIYSVRSTKDEAVLDSFHDLMVEHSSPMGSESQGKHTGPVWQLKWIEKERGSGEERAEVLVSVSTDGRVTQWSIRKGFECNDLMRLKRTAAKQNPRGKEKKSDALISRYAGGFCFDFNAKDNNIYLAGTEEGHIHKCSCSYNEQFLDSYFGHTGPVYKIQWSPFVPDIFLSCSADWSIKLWRQDRNKPIISFHSSTKSVNDICWSPKSSTVFACVNEGSVEVWDLFQNTLDPIIILAPLTPNEKLSTVTFAKNSDCILVGTSEGYVQVLELRCMPPPPENQVESLMNVIKSSLASQLQSNKSV
ncbi:dynein axonemal intermediate chain 4-like isoform X1 [Lineus longissimus]|uniref:dynein axonemal intermediate chain 4-like isoform X1 n=1 Tax=Lineus longissimus TaxID=88925 RepID=UPI002B4D1EB1